MGENKNKVDYEIIIQAIASYLLGAMEFISDRENVFSVGLIPDGHHIYTGALKASGYRLLRPAKTLILIGEGVVTDKVSVFNGDLDVFMGKRWKVDSKVLSVFGGSTFVDFVDHKFDWINSELPFVRIISDYTNLIFLEVGENIDYSKLSELFGSLGSEINFMFISDFTRDKPMDECKKLDSQILDFDFVQNRKDLSLIKLFLIFAKRLGKVPELLAYLNTGDVSLEKKSTNGFGCIVF